MAFTKLTRSGLKTTNEKVEVRVKYGGKIYSGSEASDYITRNILVSVFTVNHLGEPVKYVQYSKRYYYLRRDQYGYYILL